MLANLFEKMSGKFPRGGKLEVPNVTLSSPCFKRKYVEISLNSDVRTETKEDELAQRKGRNVTLWRRAMNPSGSSAKAERLIHTFNGSDSIVRKNNIAWNYKVYCVPCHDFSFSSRHSTVIACVKSLARISPMF
jgi:hypothetical protein